MYCMRPTETEKREHGPTREDQKAVNAKGTRDHRHDQWNREKRRRGSNSRLALMGHPGVKSSHTAHESVRENSRRDLHILQDPECPGQVWKASGDWDDRNLTPEHQHRVSKFLLQGSQPASCGCAPGGGGPQGRCDRSQQRRKGKDWATHMIMGGAEESRGS